MRRHLWALNPVNKAKQSGVLLHAIVSTASRHRIRGGEISKVYLSSVIDVTRNNFEALRLIGVIFKKFPLSQPGRTRTVRTEQCVIERNERKNVGKH